MTGTVSGDYAAFVEQARGGALAGSTGALPVLRPRASSNRPPSALHRANSTASNHRLHRNGSMTRSPINRPVSIAVTSSKIYADFNGPRTDLTYSYQSMDNFLNGNNCTTPSPVPPSPGPINSPARRLCAQPDPRGLPSRPNLENKPLAMSDFTIFSSGTLSAIITTCCAR